MLVNDHMSAKMHYNFLLPFSICFLKKKFLYLIDALDVIDFLVNYVFVSLLPVYLLRMTKSYYIGYNIYKFTYMI